MRLKRLLTSLTGCSDSRVLKAYVLCARANHFNPSGCRRKIRWDRVSFFAASLGLPLIVRPRFDPCRKNDQILIEPTGSPDHIRSFTFFIKDKIGTDVHNYHWKQGIFLRRAGDLKLFLRTWLTLIRLGLAVLFLRANLPLRPLWKFCIYVLQARIDRPEQVFVVDYSQAENYLLTLALPKLTKVVYVPTNSLLLEYMRYGYFENIQIVFTSPPQLDELSYYVDRGWIKLVNVMVECWTFPLLMDATQLCKDANYDLGFFSSGEWGRRGGQMRTYDLKEISENTKRGNEYWKLAEAVLKFLVNYVRCHDLKLKIFLHPFEKDLIRQFGLYPPFADYVDGKNVFISNDYNSCYSNFFEAKVGVVTISSILYDRLQFNLETYFFSPKQERWSGLKPSYYHKKFLPSFADYAFESLDELGKKLNRTLKVGLGHTNSE